MTMIETGIQAAIRLTLASWSLLKGLFLGQQNTTAHICCSHQD
ncbi:hypothetical protein sync_1486 [Synechococcus sp. CC9311]|nr:hypothetical protein sync_1486 [Synechococcus sp. CC9311]